ncbi:regulatory LuxR family protein [Sphingobacterium alimentarium]|uniref:Regulatory LuxR family protein n=1 Tax=Sphingobacterium alimentarium TaxID=797292 RepID=A0A4V2VUC8_9SPHI|nr:helix-turn-helix transcriptional regulator [Sphingobacterium alimentarium]TCV17096.1 regulatory LuxR family protein [Sphingobacterium alimentarium]
MNKQKIYAGMIDKGAEIWEDFDTKILWCSHNKRQYKWPFFPKKVIDLVKQDMLNNPDKIIYLNQWPNLRREDRIYRYMLCNFGGLDDKPDFDKHGNVSRSEYYDCGLRGKCQFEGKLCCSIKVSNGYLSKSEIEVLKLIRLPDKLIADTLHRSPETISTHLQNIREKTGESDKVNLALFALSIGITLNKPTKTYKNGNHKNR